MGEAACRMMALCSTLSCNLRAHVPRLPSYTSQPGRNPVFSVLRQPTNWALLFLISGTLGNLVSMRCYDAFGRMNTLLVDRTAPTVHRQLSRSPDTLGPSARDTRRPHLLALDKAETVRFSPGLRRRRSHSRFRLLSRAGWFAAPFAARLLPLNVRHDGNVVAPWRSPFHPRCQHRRPCLSGKPLILPY